MKNSQRVLSSLAALSLVTLPACVTDPHTGQKKISRTAVGAGIGAVGGLLIGGIIGGPGAKILGAGIGGIAGAAIGSQNEGQGRHRREQTEGRDVEVAPAGESGRLPD